MFICVGTSYTYKTSVERLHINNPELSVAIKLKLTLRFPSCLQCVMSNDKGFV